MTELATMPQAARRPLTLADGTVVQLHGPLEPDVPLVILLHGFAGDLASLTSAGTATSSWRDALLSAGCSTLSYRQAAPLGSLAPNVDQLLRIASGPLSTDRRLRRPPLTIVAHSRGGLLARLFVDRAAQTPALRGVLDRLERVVTLHAPHQGSDLAGLTVRMDVAARRLHALVRSLGLRPGVLAALCAMAASEAVAELAPGSPLLRELDRRTPPAGIEWHTFGGTSADLGRIRHLLGVPSEPGARPGPARLVRTRGLAELLGVLDRLALLAPALREGEGDLVVADASARLPFAVGHGVNPLTHIEALWDAALQAQVLELLPTGRALVAA